MKKMMFGVAALIVIGITGMTGLLNAAFHMDDISDQEYRISLKKAAAIVKNETKEHNISAIHFAVEKDLDNPTNATYEYQFFCEGQVIAVNPSTGKTTVRNDTKKATEHLFDIEKAEEFKQPQAAMKEAVSYYGKKAKVKEWTLLVKDERPYYKVRLIDGEQDRQVWISA
ncbi:hypothetical protein ACG7HL_001638 [Enterococcus faecium]|uniref:Peptidase n=1 Tax=Enterococcus faecium TaxID=1352 RepID=A0A6N3A4Z0_ENTFC|nr:MULTISPECIES: hypothetical protein [Enterococcus]EGP1921714.1 hypothetical protein [Enterococcus faecium]EGP4777746.1 hypothetical protein [Enterococcus faecium]EGP4797396.1 hypothetical protein [Enterococcus faecium]EGP4858465.1 hypothetical protein [Enterococcus faecium]EGP4876605.1 hypothetical protein [Enterococcus faecium]